MRGVSDPEEVARRARERFVPLVSSIEGFVGYYLIFERCNPGLREFVMNVDSDSPLVRHWGEHRRPPPRRPPGWAWLLLAVSIVAALVLAVWLLHGSQPW